MPGTLKVLGSDLTGPVFFFKGEIVIFKKKMMDFFVCSCFVGLVAIL